MAEKRTRRRFTSEFKAQAVERLLEGGRSLAEVATELGLSPGQLSAWRTEHLAAGSAEALAARKAEEAETLRLKRENKRLEEENLILKKAAAFSRAGSRDQVRLRGGRAGEPRRGRAVPGRRRQRVRLLRLAARDPRRPGPGRDGGRAARPHRPHLRRPAQRLRLAAGPRRAGPRGPAAFAPARRAADARAGPVRPPGPPPGAPHDRQPPRPPGRPQPARPQLRRRATRHRLARRHQLPSHRRGLALPGRDRGPGHPRDPPGPAPRAGGQALAGRWPTTCGRGCASTPWSWPCTAAGPTRA
jgi:transposase